MTASGTGHAVKTVPSLPAQGRGAASLPALSGINAPSAYAALCGAILACASYVGSIFTHFHAHVSSRVLVVTLRCATWLILASASPRKPYVPRDERSSNALILDVVNRSQRIGRSRFCGRARSVATPASSSGLQSHPDATPVVLDLQELQASLLDRNADSRRSGVQRVLNQLLQRIRRPLDDLYQSLQCQRVLLHPCEQIMRTSPAAMRFTTASGSLAIALGAGGAAEPRVSRFVKLSTSGVRTWLVCRHPSPFTASTSARRGDNASDSAGRRGNSVELGVRAAVSRS